MGRKIFYLDDLGYAGSYKVGIEENCNVPVILTKNIRLVKKSIDEEKCGLVIADPVEFNNISRKSALIPVFEAGKKNLIKIILWTSIPVGTVQEMYGINIKLYDVFLGKIDTLLPNFYKIVRNSFKS